MTFNGPPVAPGEIKRNGLKALHLSRHDCGKTKAEKPSPPPREKDKWRVSWKHQKKNNKKAENSEWNGFFNGLNKEILLDNNSKQ